MLMKETNQGECRLEYLMLAVQWLTINRILEIQL
jgi:hypothetical protein